MRRLPGRAPHAPRQRPRARPSRQLRLPLRHWGGKRPGAGRKPKGPRAGVPHVARPPVSRHHPLHVTLRFRRSVPDLRQSVVLRRLRACLAAGKERFGLGVVHYSIQSNHVHLIIEARDRASMMSGVRGLEIRIARAINGLLGRRGRVLADRYYARALRTPREVRNALAYVLLNWRRHSRSRADLWDLCSSGAVFDGWRGADPARDVSASVLRTLAETRAPPRTWLLRVGWRRRGLVDPRETPGPP